MDTDRQVEYWRASAADDLEAATLLLDNSKVNQGLFFAHLALEKALKALVCRATRSTPPFTHSLPRLARLVAVDLRAEQQKLLARISAFHLRGRYELPARPLISADEARAVLGEIGELVQWLANQ